MENHGKYGGFIYARKEKALYINLFIPSELSWKEKGVVLRQETKFPEQPRTHLSLKMEKPFLFTIYVRHPGWVKKGAFQIAINGAVQADDSEPSSYVAVTRTWTDGDVIDLNLPMETSFERLPDGMDDVAFLYGPIVLAAETGTDDMTGLQAGDGRWDHVPNGPLTPLDQEPILVCEPDDMAKAIQPVSDQSLTFTLGSEVQPEKYRSLRLVPFYRLADTRYVIYWQHFTPEEYQPKLNQIRVEEAAAMTLDQATVDRVTPGEQQPEVDHHFKGEDSTTGYFQDRHWRDGKGWFSYELKTIQNQPLSLAVTYWGGDSGRSFAILANDIKIADVSLNGEKPDAFETINYPIPESLVTQAPNGILTIKFLAGPGSIAGGVFDVRLIKTPN